jgi:hypothetical protein
VLAALAGLTACGSPAPTVDAAVPADAWTPPDTWSAPDVCDPAFVHVLEGVENDTVSIDLDTTTMMGAPRDLGLHCGNPGYELRWVNQAVIELHVPGTGMQGVRVSTDNAQTQIDFNTVVQLRTECRTVPTGVLPPTCFDNVSTADVHSVGGATVPGGSTLYIYVTGYSDPPPTVIESEMGPVHVDIAIAPNTAPTLASGTVMWSGIDTLVTANAHDAEGPVVGYAFSLYAGAARLDFNGDGVATEDDVFLVGFDSVSGGPDYVAQSRIRGASLAVEQVCTMSAHCTQMGIQVYDQAMALSNVIRVNLP